MNPEFRRNLWLEASPRRMTWAAVTLALVYAAALLSTRGRPEFAPHALSAAGFVVFLVCGLLWGARSAGGAVLGEITERTWDFQRLSALTPWQMTWGKLFGASSLAWICALSGLAAMIPLMQQTRAPDWPWRLAFLIELALLLQGLSLAAALVGVRKARAEGRPARGGAVLGGLVLGLVLLLGVAGSRGFQHGTGLAWATRIFEGQGFVDWWGVIRPAAHFRAVAVAGFAAFAVAGAWRLMRLELMMRSALLVWPAFLVYLAVFAGGFPFRNGGLGASLLTAALAVALCVYAAAFAEPADRVRLRRFASAVRAGDLAEAAHLAPAALTPLLFAAGLLLAAVLTGDVHGPRLWQTAALVAFVARDLAIVAIFRLGPRPQRGDLSAILALALAYAVGGIVAASMFGAEGAAMVAPSGSMGSVVAGLIQAVALWALAARRLSAPPAAPASAPAS
ncbi:hypothetical protein [Phenylobacterium sp.]|uniref:hypothetical protein n=1 Tax=Phenylobacterium sp. TaxID=1871053 RepID=UPI0035AF37AA